MPAAAARRVPRPWRPGRLWFAPTLQHGAEPAQVHPAARLQPEAGGPRAGVGALGSRGDPDQPPPRRQVVRGVFHESFEQRAEGPVAAGAAPHRRIGQHERRRLRRRERGRLGLHQLQAYAGRCGVAARRRQRPFVDVGADQACVRSEACAFQQLRARADERVPDHVVVPGAGDPSQRRRDRRVGRRRDVGHAPGEARVGQAARVQRPAQPVRPLGDPQLPRRGSRIVPQIGPLRRRAAGDLPHHRPPVSAADEREPVANRSGGPASQRLDRRRAGQQPHDGRGQRFVGAPGHRGKGEAEFGGDARRPGGRQRTVQIGLDLARSHDARPPAGAELLDDQRLQAGAAVEPDRSGPFGRRVGADRRSLTAGRRSFQHQHGAGRSAGRFRIGGMRGAQRLERRGGPDLAQRLGQHPADRIGAPGVPGAQQRRLDGGVRLPKASQRAGGGASRRLVTVLQRGEQQGPHGGFRGGDAPEQAAEPSPQRRPRAGEARPQSRQRGGAGTAQRAFDRLRAVAIGGGEPVDQLVDVPQCRGEPRCVQRFKPFVDGPPLHRPGRPFVPVAPGWRVVAGLYSGSAPRCRRPFAPGRRRPGPAGRVATVRGGRVVPRSRSPGARPGSPSMPRRGSGPSRTASRAPPPWDDVLALPPGGGRRG